MLNLNESISFGLCSVKVTYIQAQRLPNVPKGVRRPHLTLWLLDTSVLQADSVAQESSSEVSGI